MSVYAEDYSSSCLEKPSESLRCIYSESLRVATEALIDPIRHPYTGYVHARSGARTLSARRATEALGERHDLAVSILVGQVRSMAVDLLRSTGMNQAEALAALEEVAPRGSEDP